MTRQPDRCAIVLVAGMLLERRRTDLALMRSRGASTVHLGFMALTESAILAAAFADRSAGGIAA